MLKKSKTPFRIALTGTPLQNNLEEYWCMIDFVIPGIIGDINYFRSNYSHPIENGMHKDCSESDRTLASSTMKVLTEYLKPFVLRRDETVLHKYLPPKTEYILGLTLSDFQYDLYSNYIKIHVFGNAEVLIHQARIISILNHPIIFKKLIVNHIKEQKSLINKLYKNNKQSTTLNNNNNTNNNKEINTDENTGMKDIDDEDNDNDNDDDDESNIINSSTNNEEITETDEELIEKSKFHWINSIFNKYKNVDDVRYSQKMKILKKIIEFCKEKQSKVLIFTEYVFTFEYIHQTLLKNMNLKFKILDSKVPSYKRQEIINEFNENNEYTVFLATIRVSGLGYNLITANRVVLLDMGWNPTLDNQAISRTYRYGQKKPVFVYRFYGFQTLEESLFKTNIKKIVLSKRTIDIKKAESRFDKKELKYYFTIPEKNPERFIDIQMPSNDPLLNILIDEFKKEIITTTLYNSKFEEDTFEDADPSQVNELKKIQEMYQISRRSTINEADGLQSAMVLDSSSMMDIDMPIEMNVTKEPTISNSIHSSILEVNKENNETNNADTTNTTNTTTFSIITNSNNNGKTNEIQKTLVQNMITTDFNKGNNTIANDNNSIINYSYNNTKNNNNNNEKINKIQNTSEQYMISTDFNKNNNSITNIINGNDNDNDNDNNNNNNNKNMNNMDNMNIDTTDTIKSSKDFHESNSNVKRKNKDNNKSNTEKQNKIKNGNINQDQIHENKNYSHSYGHSHNHSKSYSHSKRHSKSRSNSHSNSHSHSHSHSRSNSHSESKNLNQSKDNNNSNNQSHTHSHSHSHNHRYSRSRSHSRNHSRSHSRNHSRNHSQNNDNNSHNKNSHSRHSRSKNSYTSLNNGHSRNENQIKKNDNQNDNYDDGILIENNNNSNNNNDNDNKEKLKTSNTKIDKEKSSTIGNHSKEDAKGDKLISRNNNNNNNISFDTNINTNTSTNSDTSTNTNTNINTNTNTDINISNKNQPHLAPIKITDESGPTFNSFSNNLNSVANIELYNSLSNQLNSFNSSSSSFIDYNFMENKNNNKLRITPSFINSYQINKSIPKNDPIVIDDKYSNSNDEISIINIPSTSTNENKYKLTNYDINNSSNNTTNINNNNNNNNNNHRINNNTDTTKSNHYKLTNNQSTLTFEPKNLQVINLENEDKILSTSSLTSSPKSIDVITILDEQLSIFNKKKKIINK